MKPVAVVALSVLTLAGSVVGAEARGLRLRGSGLAMPHRAATPHGSTVRPVPTVAAAGALGLFDPSRRDTNIVTRSVMTSEAAGADDAAPIPPMPPAPAPDATRKAAEPWCPSGRIAGAGTGFCLIN